MRYIVCFGWMRSHWVLHCQNVHKSNPENVNKWEGITEQANYCIVLLLHKYGLYWLTVVI